MGRAVQLDRHVIQLSGFQGLRLLAPVPVGQVEHAIGDAGRLARRPDVAQTHRELGHGSVGRDPGHKGWQTEDLQRLLQRLTLEHQGPAVLLALVIGQVGHGGV